ncbi:S49 family peptidase [Frigidibacter sp. MR17.14]|uniref:S49 family peptidase n=1 Tax=Frigidibacter sp. MR17.14 TaxID=3126509 RepID=UPI003012CEE6
MTFAHVYAAAFNTPLLVAPAKAQAFAAGFGPRILGASQLEVRGGEDQLPEAVYRRAKPFASLLDQSLTESVRDGFRSGYALRDGVAVIPITGVLVHRGAWIGQSSGQTSYEGILAACDVAEEDNRVRGVALEIDTFGGTVSGCFGLAERIRRLAAVKPVHAFVAENAFSAGYALASQAHRIVLPRTGGVGSIGVVAMHVDYSRALDEAGVTITLLHSGAKKVDGNPYAPLPEAVQAEFEAEMSAVREIFVEAVAAGRGNRLSADAARTTEAATFMGQDAVRAGLADEVAEPREAFAAFVAELNRDVPTSGGGRRAQTQRSAAMADDNKTDDVGEDEIDTDPSEKKKPTEAPDAQAGAGDARRRIAAIMQSKDAEGRADLANFLAFDTDIGAELAVKILEKSGKTGGRLDSLMASDDTAIAPAAPGGGQRASMADRMKRRFAA